MKKEVVNVETEKKAVVRDGEVVEVSKMATITFPDGRKKTVEPLKIESEDAERDTNPVVLWQMIQKTVILRKMKMNKPISWSLILMFCLRNSRALHSTKVLFTQMNTCKEGRGSIWRDG